MLEYVSQINNLITLPNERIKVHYEVDFSRLVGEKRASVYSWKYMHFLSIEFSSFQGRSIFYSVTVLEHNRSIGNQNDFSGPLFQNN